MATETNVYRVTVIVEQSYSMIVDATSAQDASAKAMVDAAGRLPAVDFLENDPAIEMLNRSTKAPFVEREHSDPRPRIKN